MQASQLTLMKRVILQIPHNGQKKLLLKLQRKKELSLQDSIMQLWNFSVTDLPVGILYQSGV